MKTIEDIKKIIKTKDYDFLRTNEHLSKNIMLLAVGGSIGYGTNTEDSDIDVRGIALNSKQELLGITNDFEQVFDEDTDTTIYSFKKMIRLLISNNPNTIEILGFPKDKYLYLSPEGKILLDNKKLFLSKKCVNSFGGYANSQLYRLNQKAAHQLSQSELEKHILKTLEFISTTFQDRYSGIVGDFLKLYIDKSNQENYDTEIFMDVNLHHYPLRDYCGLWNELKTTVSQYSKLGKRNKNALDRGKIAKHAMHLIRLYIMCLDILENEEINTYREKEHDLLIDIRNGKYLNENDQPIPEFFEMVNDYEKKLDYAKENTSLPDSPDYERINELVIEINEMVIKNEI